MPPWVVCGASWDGPCKHVTLCLAHSQPSVNMFSLQEALERRCGVATVWAQTGLLVLPLSSWQTAELHTLLPRVAVRTVSAVPGTE